jgi:hypothetical protein
MRSVLAMYEDAVPKVGEPAHHRRDREGVNAVHSWQDNRCVNGCGWIRDTSFGRGVVRYVHADGRFRTVSPRERIRVPFCVETTNPIRTDTETK